MLLLKPQSVIEGLNYRIELPIKLDDYYIVSERTYRQAFKIVKHALELLDCRLYVCRCHQRMESEQCAFLVSDMRKKATISNEVLFLADIHMRRLREFEIIKKYTGFFIYKTLVDDKLVLSKDPLPRYKLPLMR